MTEFDVNNFDALRISLASAEDVRSWSRGEVKKPPRLFLGLVEGDATQRHAHSGKQLRNREGLCQVIIGPRIKSRHLIGILLARRQNDDRHTRPPAHRSDDLRPVAIGQSQIQNDEVDIPRARKVSESRRSRGCLTRTIAVHVKGTRNQIAHRRVILHNEDNALISIAQRPHSLPRRRQPEPLRAALPREERTRTRNREDRHRATRYHCRAPLR